MRVKPFQALRPPEPLAQTLACVPYDTVTTEEASILARGNPHSYLHVVCPEIDLPHGASRDGAAPHRKAAETFAAFQKQEWLVRDGAPRFHVYRLRMGRHVQHGIVACCHIEDYENNVIRKHENTRPDKEDDRTRHIAATHANTEPLILTYRDAPTLNRLVAAAEDAPPMFDFKAVDGVVHTVWPMSDSDAVISAFADVPAAYIADGHHRAAASVRVGAERRAANASHTGNEEYNWFMTVLFPAGQLHVMPYNRCVKDLRGKSPEQFLIALKKDFRVSPSTSPTPASHGHTAMYLNGKWQELAWELPCEIDPVASLDVSCLQDRLLAPLLGIVDPRKDKRIEFIGGIRGTDDLVRRVDSGRATVAFSMHPVSVEQVMAVCDSGRLMPPKSTWFEPKLRSGLLIHTL